MNERMIELYREACEFAYKICKEEGRTGGHTDHIWTTLSTGKFAELIVRECAMVADQWVNDEDNGTNLVSDRLRQHFGVEL